MEDCPAVSQVEQKDETKGGGMSSTPEGRTWMQQAERPSTHSVSYQKSSFDAVSHDQQNVALA